MAATAVMYIKPKDDSRDWFPQFVADSLNTVIDIINNVGRYLGLGEDLIAGEIIYNESLNRGELPLNIAGATGGDIISKVLTLFIVAIGAFASLRALEYTIVPITKPIGQGGLGGLGTLILIGAGVYVFYRYTGGRRF